MDRSQSHPSTQVLASLIGRLSAGESAARDELLRHATTQLERLVRMQLRGFPLVRRWEETADVLQQVLLRLCRALEQVKPRDVRDFFALSSKLIRRELIDLKRHHYGPEGHGAHHATNARDHSADDSPEPLHGAEAGTETLEPSRLAEWTEFHRRVEAMPQEWREVVDLLWYQGLTQDEAAEVLGVSSKTVGRRWREARVDLGTVLRG
jgi:RNA polymerase sigma-70 factor (ECF subfamily)